MRTEALSRLEMVNEQAFLGLGKLPYDNIPEETKAKFRLLSAMLGQESKIIFDEVLAVTSGFGYKLNKNNVGDFVQDKMTIENGYVIRFDLLNDAGPLNEDNTNDTIHIMVERTIEGFTTSLVIALSKTRVYRIPPNKSTNLKKAMVQIKKLKKFINNLQRI